MTIAGDFTSAARGTTAANFLKLGAGARAAGMGEAYSAVADEASALYWNPAALTRVPSKSATFMHAAYIDSSFFDYGAFAQNLGPHGAWGLGVQYFSAGSIVQTDDTGTGIGNFTPNDLAVSLGYAYPLHDLEFMSDIEGYSVGIAGKYVQSSILATAKTGAVDIGLLTRPCFQERFRFAATLVNAGGSMKFEQASEDLPLAFRFGAAYRLLDRWLVSTDVGLPKDNNTYAAAGTEYVMALGPSMLASARAGFNSRTIGDIDGFTSLSFGLGLGLGRLGFDYGFVPFGSVGQTHRVSVTAAF